MKNLRWSLLAGLGLSTAAMAHVRQRTFLQTDAEGSGQESVLHWAQAQWPVKVTIHGFAGTLGKSSALNSSAARVVMGESFKRWTDPLSALSSSLAIPLTMDLDTATTPSSPYVTSSACESLTNGDADGANNIVFTSKLDTTCADSLAAEDSVIGVTHARYSQKDGHIVEADIQFNDTNFQFKNSGVNNLTSNPKQINLYDVAVHEMGHFFGLDHSSVRNSTMLFAVADGLQNPKTDDKMGVFSIYNPATMATYTGGLKGSVSSSGSPVFGAVVFMLNSRTLDVSASEITDPNGAFQFCALPPGPQIAFANSYTPYGVIDNYYTGYPLDGSSARAYDSAGKSYCFNPGCKVMSRTLVPSWYSKDPSTAADAGGSAMKIVRVQTGSTRQFLNLDGRTSAASLVDVANAASDAVALKLDEPRVARLSARTVPLAGTSSLTESGSATVAADSYRVTPGAGGKLNVRIASLRLYTRLKIALTVLDPNSAYLDVTSARCTSVVADEVAGVDPSLDCTGLASHDYVVRLVAAGANCDKLPGNSPNCDVGGGVEDSSTANAYYIVSAYDPDTSDAGVADEGVASASQAASTYLGLPSCGGVSATVSTGTRRDEGGGCCGSVKNLPGGPSGPKSFVLALLLSPLSWFAVWWMVGGVKRQLRRRRRNRGEPATV